MDWTRQTSLDRRKYGDVKAAIPTTVASRDAKLLAGGRDSYAARFLASLVAALEAAVRFCFFCRLAARFGRPLVAAAPETVPRHPLRAANSTPVKILSIKWADWE
jgi:hypothetical protein